MIFPFFLMIIFSLGSLGGLHADIIWDLPALNISAAGVDSSDAEIALDASGNAIAVWSSNNAVMAAYRPNGGAWGTPEIISTPGAITGLPQVAFDPFGNATAIFMQTDPVTSFDVIQSVNRPAGGTWGALESVSSEVTFTLSPQIAIDPFGNATAVWLEGVGGNLLAAASIRPFGGAWGSSTFISNLAIQAFAIQVAVDDEGNALAVWEDSSGGNTFIQGNYHPIGGSWQTPVNISLINTNGTFPQVAFDSSGNGTAIWQSTDFSPDTSILTAVLPKGGSWGIPERISQSGFNSTRPQIAIDPFGNTHAVWIQAGGPNNRIQTATRASGGSWGSLQYLSAVGGNASAPQITVDRFGTFAAIWQRSNGSNTIIQASSISLGGAWSVPQDLSTTGQNALGPQVAIGRQNNSLAVWYRFNGSNFIIQALSGTTAPSPPSVFTGQQIVNRFPAQSELFNQLNWNRSWSSGVIGYNIYRNGLLIGTVSPLVLSYQDHNRPQGVVTTYSVTAIGSGSNEGEPVSVTVP